MNSKTNTLTAFVAQPGMAHMRRLADDVPARIGPAEFGTFGALIAVRCPHDLDHLMRRAGRQWEPGSAQASHDFPVPVGAPISKCWL